MSDLNPEDYVVVTTVASFRHRYVIPVDELQKLNPDDPVDPKWALDCVTMEEVKEFSQMHLGEQIIDANVLSETSVMNLFESDNSYLSSWDEDYKRAWIRHWKEQPTEEEAAEFNKIREQFVKRNNESE